MSEPAMSDDDTAKPPRRRGQRGPDRGPRLNAKISARSIFQAASQAGQKVRRVSVDTDGRITVEMGNPELPSDSGFGSKGEQNECDTRLEELAQKAVRS